METTTSVKIETRFFKDGELVHENDLGYEFHSMTLRGLSLRLGAGVYTTQTRTVTKTIETTDWR